MAIVGSGAEPLEGLQRAAANLSPGDSVLVHVSGRLVSRDSIAFGATTHLALPAVMDLLAARTPGYLSMILDLVDGESSPEEASEPDRAAALASDAAASLGAADRGYSVLAAVRPMAEASDRIAFTRLAMPPIDDGGPPSTEALLSAMHDRATLADAFRRLIAAEIDIEGAADHGVSESLYLRDPDGNGVELYCDRPKEVWPRKPDGTLAMYTKPLDLEKLLAEAKS